MDCLDNCLDVGNNLIDQILVILVFSSSVTIAYKEGGHSGQIQPQQTKEKERLARKIKNIKENNSRMNCSPHKIYLNRKKCIQCRDYTGDETNNRKLLY